MGTNRNRHMIEYLILNQKVVSSSPILGFLTSEKLIHRRWHMGVARTDIFHIYPKMYQ
jgi:hypothetical protein